MALATASRTAALALFVVTASCSPKGGQGTTFGPVLPAVNSPQLAPAAADGTVRVKIDVPIVAGLRSHFVSPSTQSIVVKAYSAHHKLLATRTANLRTGAKGCVVSVHTLACAFAFAVAAGRDRFYATTYDRPKGKGNALSVLSNFERRVRAGRSVRLHLALEGIAHSVTMELTGGDTLKTGDATSGFQFAGLLAQTVQVAALDADGNIITGAGAPVLGLTSTDTTHISIARVSGSTNEFRVMPHAVASGITLTATAKPPAGTTLQASAGLAIRELLYVANFGSLSSAGTIAAYAPWSAQPVETIASGIGNPGVLTVDKSGNLWVGNSAGGVSSSGSITKYAPGSTTPSRTIAGVSPNESYNSLAVDSSGNVYCACNVWTVVNEYTPTGGSTPSRSLNSTNSPTGISMPYSVAVDSSGNLYVANEDSNAIGIAVYPSTGVTPARNITSGINHVALLAFDKLGNLYAGNYGTPSTITEYTPGSSTVANTFESAGLSQPVGIAVDSAGSVYASNYPGPGTSTALEYTQTSTGSPVRTFSLTGAFIWGITTDPAGNVYLPVSQTNVVEEYPAGTSTTSSRTLTSVDGINNPQAVVTWP